MIRVRGRWAALLAVGLSLVVAGTTAAASWSSPTKVGPKYAFGFGSQLALSSNAGGSFLQAQFTLDFINGNFASDDGPYMGVFHARRSTSSSTWSTPVRLSANGQHASRGAIAASGPNVYAAWVTQTSYEDYKPGAERLLTFRHNTSHGASGAWGTRQVLSLMGGRVDFPSVAGSAGMAYVAYTNADSGDVHLVRGAHAPGEQIPGFSGQAIGTTSFDTGPNGFAGLPAVAASGANVGVAWLSDADGTIKARVSDNAGDDLAVEEPIGTNAVDGPQAFALGDRFAVAWPTATKIRVRIFTPGSGWGDLRTAATFSADGAFKTGYGATVALSGTERVGVAWSECRRADCSGVNGASPRGVDVAWRESVDNGLTWQSKVSLTDSTRSGRAANRRRINDYPSIVFDTSTQRYTLYNTASASFSTSQLYLRAGSGAP